MNSHSLWRLEIMKNFRVFQITTVPACFIIVCNETLALLGKVCQSGKRIAVSLLERKQQLSARLFPHWELRKSVFILVIFEVIVLT